MLLNFLAVTSENALKGYPKDIRIGEAAIYALLGFLVVFAGIVLLIAIVWAIGRIMAYVNGEPSEKQKAQLSQPSKVEEKQEPVIKATDMEEVNEDEPDEETVAVITAALMAYFEQNYPKCEFTVKRIKRI